MFVGIGETDIVYRGGVRMFFRMRGASKTEGIAAGWKGGWYKIGTREIYTDFRAFICWGLM